MKFTTCDSSLKTNNWTWMMWIQSRPLKQRQKMAFKNRCHFRCWANIRHPKQNQNAAYSAESWCEWTAPCRVKLLMYKISQARQCVCICIAASGDVSASKQSDGRGRTLVAVYCSKSVMEQGHRRRWRERGLREIQGSQGHQPCLHQQFPPLCWQAARSHSGTGGKKSCSYSF